MPYRIDFAPAARRTFEALPRDAQKRMAIRIDSLAANPRPPGTEKLAGLDATWRLRVGDYRIIYQVDDRKLVVLVVKVGHRREAYRGL